MRQPDFIGYIDTLSGKLRHSQPITDLPGTFQWAKLREKHPEPLFITVDPVAHKAEPFASTIARPMAWRPSRASS